MKSFQLNKKKTHSSIQKPAKEINQAIYKKEIWMANKYEEMLKLISKYIQQNIYWASIERRYCFKYLGYMSLLNMEACTCGGKIIASKAYFFTNHINKN